MMALFIVIGVMAYVLIGVTVTRLYVLKYPAPQPFGPFDIQHFFAGFFWPVGVPAVWTWVAVGRWYEAHEAREENKAAAQKEREAHLKDLEEELHGKGSN